MERIIVRSASKIDIPELLEIKKEESQAAYKTGYGPPSLREVSLWFECKLAGNFPVICAISSGEIVGYATYKPLLGNLNYQYSVEYFVYVKTKSRKKGIGRLLSMTVVEHAKAGNYNSIIAHIDNTNQKSINFHKRFGFTVLAQIRKVGFHSNQWTDLSILEMKLNKLAIDERPIAYVQC